MTNGPDDIRVLYSFPHKLGADRICYTAWQQINGLARAGAHVLAFPASSCRPVPATVHLRPTLARGRWRIPYGLIGSQRAFAMHDFIVARQLEALSNKVDIVHAWPRGALRTMKVARRLGIPVVLERPNAHTRFAYEVVRDECERIGVALPFDHEHAFNEDVLRLEEAEFAAADCLLCPSDFVVQTFADRGFHRSQLARHIYGYDDSTYFPKAEPHSVETGLRVLFVGVCAVRKGLHFALEAWLRSSAHRKGTFSIAGGFLPAYEEKLKPLLEHPSVRVLGHRNDIPQLMRESDVLVLPSIEEGFGLVCTEAMGSGCVPLVSDACTDLCRHEENAMVHRIGDVEAMSLHLTRLDEDRALLQKLRGNGISLGPRITWTAAGSVLRDVYARTIRDYSAGRLQSHTGHSDVAIGARGAA